MIEPQECCAPPELTKRETLPYYEYYLGEQDEEKRRQGQGRNCWTGPESIEWYCGKFVRDTMHGPGEYRCRYRGEPGLFLSYEGPLYLNRMHGYGLMSYADGKVYTGLFNNDSRYGPGVERFADVRANVGLWRGNRLLRLAWRPAPAVTPDLQAWPRGPALVNPQRTVLQTAFKTIDKVNQAIEFLKQQGSDPMFATENWVRIYPRHCTDTASQLCHVELFDYEYYGGKVYSLERREFVRDSDEELDKDSQNSLEFTGPFYAWNNNDVIIDMMKHSFQQERQRQHAFVDLAAVLSGPRSAFQPPAMHELDCRTLLMACYLGHVATTTYLVNERRVDPNITDMLGNSAVMYAACGDQPDLINFLVEAGAEVDGMSDSCCTPLAAALVRFLCARRDVPVSAMMPALIPPPVTPVPPPELQTVFDWNITREMIVTETTKHTLGKATSKLNKLNIPGKVKSLTSVKVPMSPTKKNLDDEDDDLESKLYRDVNNEYIIKVTDLLETVTQPVTYLFEIKNMIDQVNEEQVKMAQPDKTPKGKASKMLKELTKPSKEAIWQNPPKDELSTSETSAEILKNETLARIKTTLLQLLANGAKPSLVRCPQPALVMAILAGSPDLVTELVRYGANVNEVYPQHLQYTPLQIAVSQPLSPTTLELVQALLLAGARADTRLTVRPPSPKDPAVLEPQPGPTLMHVMLVKRAENEVEEDIRRQIMHVLLEHNCNALLRYNGRSALDEASKNLELLDIIIKSPKTDLNAPINDSNQTILVKMFYMPYFKTLGSLERSQTITDLLLFGADPLIECECEGIRYENLFVMAKKILFDMTNQGKTSPKGQKPEPSPAKGNKGKKDEPKKEARSSEDVEDLKQAIDLMTECSRILYIRWLQTQLAKDIIQVISRYKHRHWSMMIKECEHRKAAGLWITAQRCLEIWSHLKTTRKKMYNDKTILRNLLCIAHFFHLRSVTSLGFKKVTAEERDEAEAYAQSILRDNKKDEVVPLQRYVQPELFIHADSKFNVCFECFLPLTEERVLCKSCKFVSFCNLDCLRDSVEKSNGHACNDYLLLKFFPPEPLSQLESVYDDEPNEHHHHHHNNTPQEQKEPSTVK